MNIIHRSTGEVLYMSEKDSPRGALVEAVKSGACLDGAYLDGAYLYGACLDGACLDGAYLYEASLVEASLVEASLVGACLYGAYLDGANLDGAYLDGANLDGASLGGASLDGASLYGARLDGAYLDGASLDGTCLDPEAPIPKIADELLVQHGLEPDGVWVRGWRTLRSQHISGHTYPPRRAAYIAPVFSVSATACHPGLYLAGRECLEKKYPDAELVRVRCLRDELHFAGGKFRAKRLWVRRGVMRWGAWKVGTGGAGEGGAKVPGGRRIQGEIA